MEIKAQKPSLNGGNWQIEGFFRALFAVLSIVFIVIFGKANNSNCKNQINMIDFDFQKKLSLS